MRHVVGNHFLDENGKPAGGTTYGPGFVVGWQHGPLGRGEKRKPQNGAFVEDVIRAAIDRLRFYQGTEFHCAENEAAITNLERALEALALRTRNREERGVEGTHEK